MANTILAGAAAVDITPQDSQFLFGYPFVRRYSTGVHDQLLSSALFLSDGPTSLLFVANDVIYVSRDSALRARMRIERETGIPAANVMVTATHTHSGPMTVDVLNNEADSAVPKTDPRYVERLENGIVSAAIEAFRNRKLAEVGMVVADNSCVGSNRHDPSGPSIPDVPALIVQSRDDNRPIALMLICAMHPTVLHEDSTLVSGDFPAMTRQYLQQLLGAGCPVIYHTGPCGNQSPRHVARANTIEEAERLGYSLGCSIVQALENVEYSHQLRLACANAELQLPRRRIPSIGEARQQRDRAVEKLRALRDSGIDRGEVRTAECDWFGAEESLALARAAAAGRVESAIAAVMPAEISLMRVGPWSFVGWPGECFVEFALMVKELHPNCHIISMANGELQGYLVTKEAVERRWYESMTSLFASPESGNALVEKTREMLQANDAR
jgi:neutral ceramidase